MMYESSKQDGLTAAPLFDSFDDDACTRDLKILVSLMVKFKKEARLKIIEVKQRLENIVTGKN